MSLAVQCCTCAVLSPVYVNWRLWSSSRRVVVCTPSVTTSMSARSKRAQNVLWPCHIQVGGMKETGPYCQRRRHHHRSICFFFVFFSRFTISIRSFLPFSFSAGTFSRRSCAVVVVVFSALVGWFRLAFSSSFFSVCLWWGGRDPLARLSVHLTLAFCLVCLCPVPYPLRFFFVPLHSLGPHHADIIFLFDSSSSSSSPPSWFRFVSFLSLTQDLNLLPAVREKLRKKFSASSLRCK